MGFFSSDSSQAQAYDQVNNGDPNQASWTHELVAGAAAYGAEKKYQDYEQQNGKVEDHQTAKDLMAGFAGGESDRLIETRGADFLDKEEAKRQASQQASDAVTPDSFQNYGNDGGNGGGYGGNDQSGGYGGNDNSNY